MICKIFNLKIYRLYVRQTCTCVHVSENQVSGYFTKAALQHTVKLACLILYQFTYQTIIIPIRPHNDRQYLSKLQSQFKKSLFFCMYWILQQFTLNHCLVKQPEIQQTWHNKQISFSSLRAGGVLLGWVVQQCQVEIQTTGLYKDSKFCSKQLLNRGNWAL